MLMFILFFSLLHFTRGQDLNAPYIFSDCKHLILPARCQCYHSGHESQLRCLNSELHSLPKLPNNMRWNALDFSYNYITSIDNYVFADIYVEKISLKSNYLRRIEITAFDQIKNLKQLFLNNNQLRELHPQTLASPGASLELLDLSHNPFQFLDVGEILLNLPVLKQLQLVSCHLNSSSLYTLSKLIETTLDDNNQTVAGRGHQHLELLDLSYNNFTTLCHDVFAGLHNLVELRLHHNSIHLIDNNFLRSLSHVKILNLAHNSIEHVPKLSSRSLEVLNFSSNHIQYLSDYFASDLSSIRHIDFDYNYHLNHTTSRAFCFLNILSLDRITFRSNNLLSLNSFGEFLCRLANHTTKSHLIDINNNVNLKCNCTLVQFQTFLNNYNDLTCTQQGQDRYYISKLINWFANCTPDFCAKRQRQIKLNHCIWYDAERSVAAGTCAVKTRTNEERKLSKAKLAADVERTTMRTSSTTGMLTTIADWQAFDNLTDSTNLTYAENSTRRHVVKHAKSSAISLKTRIYVVEIICLRFLLW